MSQHYLVFSVFHHLKSVLFISNYSLPSSMHGTIECYVCLVLVKQQNRFSSRLTFFSIRDAELGCKWDRTHSPWINNRISQKNYPNSRLFLAQQEVLLTIFAVLNYQPLSPSFCCIEHKVAVCFVPNGT